MADVMRYKCFLFLPFFYPRHECGFPQFNQQLDIEDRWVVIKGVDIFKIFVVCSVFLKTFTAMELVASLRRKLQVGRRAREGCEGWSQR